MKLTRFITTLLAASATLLTAASSRGELLSYYIGIDNLPTIATGTYAGLPNPNFNHLTFLYAHTYPVGGVPTGHTSNHYHSKGTLIYTGPNLGANTEVIRSMSDFLPEGTRPPLALSLGTGIYSDKLITNPYTDPSDRNYGFSFLEVGSTQSLAGFEPNDGETFLFNSSSGRWNSAFTPAHLHLELVSLTPGLNWGDPSATNIGFNNPGDQIHLTDPGTENNFFRYTPVLWTDASAAPGVYEAKFKIFDEDGTFGDSGEIRYRVEVVPEPSTALTLLGGVGMLLARRRRVAPADDSATNQP
jgi:hypothetical protein